MTVVPVSDPDPPAAGRRHAVSVSAQAGRTGPGTVTVVVRGEIDAANTDELLTIASRAVRPGGRLVLDCSAVTFFAVEGFSAVQRVNVMCARAGTAWVLIPSAAVSRVFALFDGGGAGLDPSPGGTVVPMCSARAAGLSRRLRLVRGPHVM